MVEQQTLNLRVEGSIPSRLIQRFFIGAISHQGYDLVRSSCQVKPDLLDTLVRGIL